MHTSWIISKHDCDGKNAQRQDLSRYLWDNKTNKTGENHSSRIRLKQNGRLPWCFGLWRRLPLWYDFRPRFLSQAWNRCQLWRQCHDLDVLQSYDDAHFNGQRSYFSTFCRSQWSRWRVPWWLWISTGLLWIGDNKWMISMKNRMSLLYASSRSICQRISIITCYQ